MLRAQGSLPDAAMCFIYFLLLCCMLPACSTDDFNVLSSIDQRPDLEAFFNTEWSDENLEQLQRIMDEHVERFRKQLLMAVDKTAPEVIHSRTKRDVMRIPLITGMERIISDQLNGTNNLNLSSPAVFSCFTMNHHRFCILGNTIYKISNGRFEDFLIGLPIGPGDYVKTHVHDNAVFIAIYNKNSPPLRLYVLRSPDWKTMVVVQDIDGERIEDCVFFESDGTLFMSLAIHLGPRQYFEDAGTQFVIYKWIKTTMDKVQNVPISSLRQIVVLKSDTTQFILIHDNARIQRWGFISSKNKAEPLDVIIDVGLPYIHNVDAFIVNSRWCLLLGGTHSTVFYVLLENSRFIEWQIVQHAEVTNEVSWMRIQQAEESRGGYDAVILIFSTFKPQSPFHFYVSDTSGRFVLTHNSALLNGMSIPAASVSFLNETTGNAQLYISKSPNGRDNFTMDSFEIHLIEEKREDMPPDALLQCLANVDGLIDQLSQETVDRAEELVANMIHVNDNFETSGTVVVAGLEFSQTPSLDRIQVLYDYNETFTKPEELERNLNEVNQSALELSKELPNLLYSDSTSFKGQLELTGTVKASVLNTPSATAHHLNGRNWTEFTEKAWRYSIPQIIDHDMTIDTVTAENVTVGYTIGVTNPSLWLLRSTGGVLSGQSIILSGLDVGSKLEIGDHSINGIKLSEVFLLEESDSVTVQGTKHFAKIEVFENVSVKAVNGRNFRKWVDGLVMQRSDREQHLTGTIRLEGPVRVKQGLGSESINGINVTHLAESVVNTSSESNIVNGIVTFTSSLVIAEAHAVSLNGMLIEDLLSTSGNQIIRADVNIDTIHVSSDLESHDINGVDLDDLLYVNDIDSEQPVSGRILFGQNVTIQHLVMEDGTLNDLDVIHLLDPPELRIDSPLEVVGNWSVIGAQVIGINHTDLRDLRGRFWTKSTDQIIRVNHLKMPFEVTVEGNVTTKTFLGRPLDGNNFYLTGANESFSDNIVFMQDIFVLGDLKVDNLTTINNISLRDFADNVVLKEGSFQLIGTKTFEELTILGNLKLKETLNGLKVPQDIALLDRNQKFQNLKFNSDAVTSGDVVCLEGDVNVITIAGIDLDDFVKQAVTIDEDAFIDGDVFFDDHLDVNDLVVQNLLNGHHIDNITQTGISQSANNSIKLSNLTVYGQVTFEGLFVAENLNGHNVNEYLGQVVDLTQPQLITGTKSARMVDATQDVNIRSFNGVSFDLSKILTASGDQNITGDFVIEHLFVNSVQLGAINGHNMTDYVQTAGTKEVQIIEGDLSVDIVQVNGTLSVESRIINGCNLTQYLSLEDVDQFESLVLSEGTTLKLEQPWTNNPEMAMLLYSALRTDRDQIVSGAVSLKSDAAAKHITIPHNMFGDINLPHLFNKSMLKSAEQNVTGPIEYANEIAVDGTVNTGHLDVVNWDGQDSQQLVDNVVVKTGSQTIEGRKILNGHLKIQNNLNVTGSIDGVAANALVKTTDARLPAGMQFSNLVIDKELNITNGLIDGVNLTSLFAKRVPLIGDVVIRGSVTFSDTVSTENITMPGVNGMNVSSIAWKTAGPEQIFTGRKILKSSLQINGDLLVSQLNGRNPEEEAAFMVLKDQDVEFEKSIVFRGGLNVMKEADIRKYDDKDLTGLLDVASRNLSNNFTESGSDARSLINSLQKSPSVMADFEYFEQIQEVSFNFLFGSNVTVSVHHCPLPTRNMGNSTKTATGILTATHSTDGNSCGLEKQCRCHGSVSLPTDGSGHLNTLRIPTRLKEYLEDKQIYGDRIQMLSSREQLFIISIETLSGCMAEKVSIAVFDSITFKMSADAFVFEVNDTVVDVALERRPSDGQIYLAVSQSSSGIWIYTFDGHSFNLSQIIETEPISSIDMISNSQNSSAMFLAIASYGLDAMSSIFSLNNKGRFELLKDIATIGATDIKFTESKGDIYLTIGQDPSSIDPFSDKWTQLKVPAQVHIFVKSMDNFELIQQLDLDRVTSLANSDINGSSFIVAATFHGRVRVYRLVRGQGFQPEQTFKVPGIKSITGYSIQNESYLIGLTESRATVYAARLRGFQKPTITI